VIAYATAPGTTADDGDGANSPYTTALLRALATPGKKAEEVFKDTRVQLARTTNNRQISWESSSLIGDFYFTPAAGATAAPALPPPAVAPAPPAASVEPQSQPRPQHQAAPAEEPASPPAKGRGKVVFDIVNGLERRIVQLYLSAASAGDWEENVLQAPLDAGDTLEMTVDDETSECLYDLRAVFKGRKDVERRGINICKLKSYTIE